MPHWYSTSTFRFASITINLGPTFLSGTMAANINHKPREPSCPLVQGPFRHYIINFLWIFVNIICIGLTIYHLVKLYRDYTHPSADTVRVATLVTSIVSGDSNASEVRLICTIQTIHSSDIDKCFDINNQLSSIYLPLWSDIWDTIRVWEKYKVRILGQFHQRSA